MSDHQIFITSRFHPQYLRTDDYRAIYRDVARSARIVSFPNEITGEVLDLIARGWQGELWL
jgi:hypothetical protein